MINAIIFSKDRPMQLDCLLRSMRKNLDYVNPVVIYKATTKEFQDGYDEIELIPPFLIKETDLKKDVLSNMDTKIVAFFTDDDIVFRKPEPMPINRYHCYSLRLGLNIKNHVHFDYPMSLDGHFFNSADLRPFITSIEFSNPNKLESKLHHSYSKLFSVVFNYQCLVGVCHNRVSDTSHCHFTGKYPAEMLNKMFLEGKRIDFESMDFSGLTDVHCEIDYKFKNL